MGKNATEVLDFNLSLSAAGEWSAKFCPYCGSDNAAIRATYFDQNCAGCVARMGSASGVSQHGEKA